MFFPQKSPTMQCIHAKKLHSRVRFPQKESYSTVFSPRKSPKIEMLSNHIWNVTWLTHTWHDPLTHVIWLKMRDITPSHTHIHKHKHPHTHDTWHDPLTHVIWLESLEWHDKYPTHMTPPHTWASSSQGYWASEGCLSSKSACHPNIWMRPFVNLCCGWCRSCCGCDLWSCMCVCLCVCDDAGGVVDATCVCACDPLVHLWTCLVHHARCYRRPWGMLAATM